MQPTRNTRAWVFVADLARLNAAALPSLDGNENVLREQIAASQGDADHAVSKFTAGKLAAVTGVPAATRTVVKDARATVLVDKLLALARLRDVADRAAVVVVLGSVRRDRLAVARVVVLAQEQVAVKVALLGSVDLDHFALVELRTADGARLGGPALRIAVSVALVAADRAEHKVHAVVEAGALTLHNDDRLDKSTGLQLEGSTGLSVVQRQSDVLAARRDQVTRDAQARDLLRRAEAVRAFANFASLDDRKATILKDEAQLVGEFPTVVVKLSESRSHFF